MFLQDQYCSCYESCFGELVCIYDGKGMKPGRSGLCCSAEVLEFTFPARHYLTPNGLNLISHSFCTFGQNFLYLCFWCCLFFLGPSVQYGQEAFVKSNNPVYLFNFYSKKLCNHEILLEVLQETSRESRSETHR